MAHDAFDTHQSGLTSPLSHGFAITPANDADLAHTTRELFVGGGGNVVLVLKSGDEITLSNLADGTRLPYRVARVKATGTTATALVGLY